MNNAISLLTLIMGTMLTSCLKHESRHVKVQAVKVENVSSPNATPKITLSAEAIKRLDIASRAFPRDRDGKQTVPISALIYDTQGQAWVYIEREPSIFHREHIRVAQARNEYMRIESNFADYFRIVTQGAAELNGAESGIGK